MPTHKCACVCEHAIKHNCYITDGTDIIVIGNCCIKKFMEHCNRTYEICNKPHKIEKS